MNTNEAKNVKNAYIYNTLNITAKKWTSKTENCAKCDYWLIDLKSDYVFKELALNTRGL